MAYVGTPLDTTNAFQSLAGKRFSGDASTTDFTLDSSPNSTLDIEVFVGNVRQDPNSAYTVSGTTLGFTAAPPSGTNNIYVVHQAKSVGTIDVPSASVQSGSLNSAFFTGATDIGAAIADADLFLLDDGAGGTLRKTAASRIKTYVGDNTPSFYGYLASDQTISANTWTKMSIATESWDTDSAFASNKFTIPSGEGGKYCMGYSVGSKEVLDNTERLDGKLYVNGSAVAHTLTTKRAPGDNLDIFINFTTVLDLSASDYVELYARHTDANNQDMDAAYTRFWGFKLAGV